MGSVRVYDKNINDWVVVSTSDASSTSVRSEKLLPEGVSTTNVEEVLINMKDDIDLLKSNVSWLAKHGGGGSGGGTGGGGSVSAEIFVEGLPTGSDIILSDSLTITVQASNSSLLWDITAVGTNKVLRSSSNTIRLVISKNDIEKAGITSTFQLSITATNNNTLSQVYWNGTIYISNVSLYTEGTNNTFDNYQNQNLQLTYSYNVGVTGIYKLMVNDKEVWRGDIVFNSGTLNIPLKNIDNLTVGSNAISSQLIKVDNNNIYSNVSNSFIVLTSVDPVINCINVSSNPESPTEYVLNESGVTILPVTYATYFTKGTYKVKIHNAETILSKNDFNSITEYNDYNVVYTNGSFLIDTTEEKIVSFTISILDSAREIIYSRNFYVQTKSPEYSLLDNGKQSNLIFDFNSFTGYIQNGIWQDNKQNSITIQNINQYSQAIDGNKIMRFQNASYGVLSLNENIPFSRYITDSNIWEFTLSLCYKADFHPDDNRVILQFSTLYGEDSNYTPSSGIVVRDHVLYIGSNSLKLQDRELTNITITFSHPMGEKMGNAFVYIDGVVEAVFKIDREQILPEGITTMYLAAQMYENQAMFYTDVDIYRVSMYDICLSPYEILYDYLNNQAYAHHINGQPDTTYIVEGLQRNFIKNTDDGKQSLLWNVNETFNNNSDQFFNYFDLGQLLAFSGVNVEFKPNIISDYNIPIPMMLIDVSHDTSWTWTNFITPGSKLEQVDGCFFQYFDQAQTNNSIISGSVWVDLQGTSTLADFIKNLNIGFVDTKTGLRSVFIPKPTWFPEEVYTLKADIVDSSHALNTSIGKFVNEELGLKYDNDGNLISTDSWYPFSETVKNTYVAQKNNPNSATQKYFPKATLKHGVEGFPVFLIMRFHDPESEAGEVKSLGIYQFILGRNSARNLGYEIIGSVTGMDEAATIKTYPYYKENVEIITIPNKGYWVEMGQNDSFSDQLNFQEMDSEKFGQSQFTGAFWQSDDSDGLYYNNIAEVKYHSFGNDAITDLTRLTPFVDFVNNIKAMPVTNRRYSVEKAGTLQRNTFKNMQYPKYKYISNGSSREWVAVDGETNFLLDAGDTLEGIVRNDLNIESIGKYFVIAMFLGLIDNFQKNMPIKIFQKAKSQEFEPPILGIYDTDTGCGGTNEGDIKVSEDVWISPFINEDLQMKESSVKPSDGLVHQIIGNSNKLWYIDSGELNYSLYGGDDRSGSIFAGYWNSFIKQQNSAANLEDLANKFIDQYFIPQTYGCGELLFNLTYFCKYLSKYQLSGQSAPTNQYSKLHGRRIKQIRSWLRNRVKFLDSMFCAMGTPSAMEPRQSNASTINISSGSAPEFSIASNYPSIVEVNSQGSMSRFVYCSENVDTPIYWGNSSANSTPVSHTISFSDSIQNLGSDQYKLADIYYQKITAGQMPYLTDFDISNCSTVEAMSSDDWGKFKNSEGKSELRTINCENTAKTGSTINFVLDLTKGFEKLQNVNIYNSCVSQLYLPTNPNIPLLTLNIAGAQLQQLNLDTQNLIQDLNISNCNKLTSLKINNCAKLTHLNLDASQNSLNSVDISSSNFRSLSCIGNTSVKTIKIISDNLNSVVINKCTKLQSITVSGKVLEVLNLSECNNLTEVNILGPKDSITTLNLYGTKVATIKYNSVEPNSEGIMDLSIFKTIDNFNIAANSAVQYIQFTNDSLKPIIITNPFTSCTSLQRVYGHLDIRCNSTFYGCRNFSIHGSNIENVKYLNKSVVDPNGKVLHPEDISGITTGGKMVFQGSETDCRYTNLLFSTTSAQNSFRETNCTLFDIYYVFYNAGNLTNFYWTFANLVTARFSWTNIVDNSPNIKLFRNKGSQITSLNSCFKGDVYTCRIFSPSHNAEGKVTADDGLLSPLINCTDLSVVFGEANLYTDRFVFRRSSGNYKFRSIRYFYPQILTDNIRNADYSIVSNATNYINNHRDVAGNFGQFFINTPEINDMHAFGDGTYFINFDLTKESGGLGIPASTTSLKAVLRASYATGDLVPEDLFANPSKVAIIQHSFLVNDTLSGFSPATFKITSGMFNSFTNLQQLTYSDSGDHTGTLFTCPFNGAGLVKTIEQAEFPYDILNPCKNTITHFRGFFQNVKSDKVTEVNLPGTLFANTPNIQYVGALFRNFGINYQLTQNSFANCPNLTEVAHMFASPDLEGKMLGSIPSKLFYHGMNPARRQIGGTYIQIDYDPYEIIGYQDEEQTIPNYRIDKELADGTTIPTTINTEYYYVPYNKITNIQGCFINCNFSAYTNSEPEIEINPNYNPGNYKYNPSTKKWVAVTPDYNKHTLIWEYDGVIIPEEYEGENLDCNHETITPSITHFGQSNTGTLNFMCAPDLLRYCQRNAIVNQLFKDSGHNNNGYIQYTNYPSKPDYGIKGRIPPYLLKPVTSITSISQMFMNCKQLSYYTNEGNVAYTIPETFFNYTPQLTDLSSAFQGLIFPSNISLDVFKQGVNNAKGLNVSRIFMYPLFLGSESKRVNIGAIFGKPLNITALTRAFSINTDGNNSSGTDQNNMVRGQYVTFDKVFENYSKDQDTYVFDGYDAFTTRFTNHTLRRDVAYANYRFSNNTLG